MVKGAGDSTVFVNLGANRVPETTGVIDGTADGLTAKVAFDASSALTINTYGTGAIGVVSQSIGAGGGYASVSPGSYMQVNEMGSNVMAGSGGSVQVALLNTDASITTQGMGAHGIVAQSIGGGGGFIANWTGRVFAGAIGVFGDAGGAVTVNVEGDITTTGANSIGVFAQSDSTDSQDGVISINIQGGASVSGGSGAQGAGIVVSGGDAHTTNKTTKTA